MAAQPMTLLPVNVLHRSIELCLADHRGDERLIQDWLANKTEVNWQAWIERKDALVLVAETHAGIVGVGMGAAGLRCGSKARRKHGLNGRAATS